MGWIFPFTHSNPSGMFIPPETETDKIKKEGADQPPFIGATRPGGRRAFSPCCRRRLYTTLKTRKRTAMMMPRMTAVAKRSIFELRLARAPMPSTDELYISFAALLCVVLASQFPRVKQQ